MYIKLSTLEFPRHEGDIRLEHKDILESQTGDTFPCPNTYAPVAYVQPPEVSETQVYESGNPIKDELGNWKITWTVRDLTAEEIQSRKEFEERMAKEQEALNQSTSNNINTQ